MPGEAGVLSQGDERSENLLFHLRPLDSECGNSQELPGDSRPALGLLRETRTYGCPTKAQITPALKCQAEIVERHTQNPGISELERNVSAHPAWPPLFLPLQLF